MWHGSLLTIEISGDVDALFIQSYLQVNNSLQLEH